MSITVISKELFKSQLFSVGNGVVLDFANTEACISLLKTKKEIIVYDITYNKKIAQGTKVLVNDHINFTGENPLVGRQENLGVDFVDMTNVYVKSPNGVIAHSCGNKIKKGFFYPTHFLSHIVIIARALNYKKITAYLVNSKDKHLL